MEKFHAERSMRSRGRLTPSEPPSNVATINRVVKLANDAIISDMLETLMARRLQSPEDRELTLVGWSVGRLLHSLARTVCMPAAEACLTSELWECLEQAI